MTSLKVKQIDTVRCRSDSIKGHAVAHCELGQHVKLAQGSTGGIASAVHTDNGGSTEIVTKAIPSPRCVTRGPFHVTITKTDIVEIVCHDIGTHFRPTPVGKNHLKGVAAGTTRRAIIPHSVPNDTQCVFRAGETVPNITVRGSGIVRRGIDVGPKRCDNCLWNGKNVRVVILVEGCVEGEIAIGVNVDPGAGGVGSPVKEKRPRQNDFGRGIVLCAESGPTVGPVGGQVTRESITAAHKVTGRSQVLVGVVIIGRCGIEPALRALVNQRLCRIGSIDRSLLGQHFLLLIVTCRLIDWVALWQRKILSKGKVYGILHLQPSPVALLLLKKKERRGEKKDDIVSKKQKNMRVSGSHDRFIWSGLTLRLVGFVSGGSSDLVFKVAPATEPTSVVVVVAIRSKALASFIVGSGVDECLVLLPSYEILTGL